jgi:hypothetical protein
MDREEARVVAETASELFKKRFGYAPDHKDKKSAAEYVLWRYGRQGFVDAVMAVREMRSAAEAARARAIIEGA